VIIDFRSVRTLYAPADVVVIVGSGAAGLALSECLSKSGRPVILLESGSDVKGTSGLDGQASELNQGISLGVSYAGLVEGRARVLGGTTELWHGQCMRLHDIDLRARPWIANSGWPLELADLNRQYLAAERWLDVSGKGYGSDRWDEHPELAPIAWDPAHLLHDFTEYAPRPRLGYEHRHALASNRLVHAVVNVTVSRILVRDERVMGVEACSPDGHRSTIAASKVVLAAGAVENARLLLLSDPDGVGLGDGRDHTGRFLQDHPIVRTAEVIPRDYRVLQDRYLALHSGSRRLFPKVRLAPAAQEKHELLDATAVFVHDHQQPALAAARRLLIAARTRRLPKRLWRDTLMAARAPLPVAHDAYRRYALGLSSGIRPSAVWLQLWLEQTPNPDSRIALGETTDSLGLRRAEVHWRVGEQERSTSRLMTRWIAADLSRLGVAQVRELDAMRDDDAWQAGVTDAFHPAGTTRMSESARDGVVDPNLQVHGVRGLYAVGGSVFPTSGYANPTLTIVALAMRLGEHLKR
jgi:choline dehydrogenase-like flavoprotein